MSQLDYVLQKQQQLTERSAIKPAEHLQPVRQHSEHYPRIPQNFNRVNTHFDPRFQPPPVHGKVFFNPDFPRQNSSVHVNPASNIYFNHNRLMQTNANPQQLHQIPMSNTNTLHHQAIPRNVSNKVHVNPAILNQSRIPVHVPPIISNNLPIPQNEFSNYWHFNPAVLNQQNIPGSVPIHINPKFVAKPIVSENYTDSRVLQQNRDTSRTCNIENTVTESVPSCSTADINNFTSSSSVSQLSIPVHSAKKNRNSSNATVSSRKFTSNSRVFKKSPNSSLISLSKRKLVRVKRNSTNTSMANMLNSTPLKRKLSSSGLKKSRISPKNKNKLVKINNMKLIRATDTHCWYKKKNDVINNNRNKKVALVDGVMFRITRNKIVRSIPTNAAPLKKQKISTLDRNSQFVTLRGGKSLYKVDNGLKKVNSSPKINVSNITSISPVKNYKSNASNKVKQRSLQILRNKMRKNNQPCLLFQKYGYCNNQLKGTCSKVHDKKQVAVCKNFLQGKCLSNDCLLSHDVGPEKMPTCKFFLEGFCSREGCPYLHVKVSSKNPICVEFLRGYCSQGNECQNRHIFACPEYDRTSACSKGKSCPYPHKSHLTKTKRPKEGSCRKSMTPAKSPTILPLTPEIAKPATRYYDVEPACNSDTEDLSKVRVKLLKKVKMMSGESLESSQENYISSDTNLEPEEEPVKMCNRKKPMGPADPFIPIT